MVVPRTGRPWVWLTSLLAERFNTERWPGSGLWPRSPLHCTPLTVQPRLPFSAAAVQPMLPLQRREGNWYLVATTASCLKTWESDAITDPGRDFRCV